MGGCVLPRLEIGSTCGRASWENVSMNPSLYLFRSQPWEGGMRTQIKNASRWLKCNCNAIPDKLNHTLKSNLNLAYRDSKGNR